MMSESKELKTPCGTSRMCCACKNPWVFYTEMLIIIIVLEHLYLPKRLPCTCSPAMERERWERTEAAAGKGKKIVIFLQKLHQFFFKPFFPCSQCGEKQVQLFHCFLVHGRKQSFEGHLSSTVLWRTEKKGWILRSYSFLFGWAGTGSVKTYFLSLSPMGTCSLTWWHQLGTEWLLCISK